MLNIVSLFSTNEPVVFSIFEIKFRLFFFTCSFHRHLASRVLPRHLAFTCYLQRNLFCAFLVGKIDMYRFQFGEINSGPVNYFIICCLKFSSRIFLILIEFWIVNWKILLSKLQKGHMFSIFQCIFSYFSVKFILFRI